MEQSDRTAFFERCGHLGVAVVGLFELHVLAGLAAQVQPLALQPLHGGLPGQGGGVHLSDEGDIGSCNKWPKTPDVTPRG